MTILKKSNCDGILIETEKHTDRRGEYITVTLCDMYENFAEAEIFEDFGSEEEALAQHDALVAEYVELR